MSRRQRRRARRRAGIPRLVTVRVLVFLILLGGIVYGAYYLVRWYANDDWYVTVQNTHLAVYHGRPGGFLWYKPKLAVESTVTTAEIPTFYVPTVKRYVEEPTLKAAQSYIVNLHQQFLATQQSSTGVTPNATTTTAAGGTTTTKPKATTTTKPKATTTTKPVATTTARP